MKTTYAPRLHERIVVTYGRRGVCGNLEVTKRLTIYPLRGTGESIYNRIRAKLRGPLYRKARIVQVDWTFAAHYGE